MLGSRPGDLADSQQAAVSGEKVLEAEIHLEIPLLLPEAIVIKLAVANQFNGLRQLLPLGRVAFENPQVPIRAHRIMDVRVQIILRQFHDDWCVERHGPQVLLEDRGLRRFDGANLQMGEALTGGRKGNRRQKFLEIFKHQIFRKVLQPNIQISLICHAPIIPGCRARLKFGRWHYSVRGEWVREGTIVISCEAWEANRRNRRRSCRPKFRANVILAYLPCRREPRSRYPAIAFPPLWRWYPERSASVGRALWPKPAARSWRHSPAALCTLRWIRPSISAAAPSILSSRLRAWRPTVPSSELAAIAGARWLVRRFPSSGCQ